LVKFYLGGVLKVSLAVRGGKEGEKIKRMGKKTAQHHAQWEERVRKRTIL